MLIRTAISQRGHPGRARRGDPQSLSGHPHGRRHRRRPRWHAQRLCKGRDGWRFRQAQAPYKIQVPPFYAAWARPGARPRAGLRINAQSQLLDLQGQVIPGLYCGGESAGGFNRPGLGRCTTGTSLAHTPAAENPRGFELQLVLGRRSIIEERRQWLHELEGQASGRSGKNRSYLTLDWPRGTPALGHASMRVPSPTRPICG